jgi:ferredoxin, 2Fe-2S
MSYPKNPIVFIVFHAGEEYTLKTFWGEYRDLRALINDKLDLEDFGQCGGMGRCATCMVEITTLSNLLPNMDRNEQSTLSKRKRAGSAVRLSCQIPIDDNLANALVQISEDN